MSLSRRTITSLLVSIIALLAFAGGFACAVFGVLP